MHDKTQEVSALVFGFTGLLCVFMSIVGDALAGMHHEV